MTRLLRALRSTPPPGGLALMLGAALLVCGRSGALLRPSPAFSDQDVAPATRAAVPSPPLPSDPLPSPPLPRSAGAARPQGSSSAADAIRALTEGSREPLVPMVLHVGDDPDPAEEVSNEPLVPRVLELPANDGPLIAAPRGSVGTEPLAPRELRLPQ